uniref:PDZ domain-containing protein n=1 Tax=Angiostrongylus cantonensis TaxID=6313 RepID=A0A0K0DAT8_ANGCA
MATTISRRDSLSLTQMRAFSAYSNLCQVEESDDIVETQLDNWLPESDDESYKLEASLLMEGDLIEGCNGKDMTGFTCEQAASILRFALLHGSVLQLQITRKRCGSLLMEKRRSLARISQEQERQLGAASLAELTRASSSRMCQSTSCPDYHSNNNV